MITWIYADTGMGKSHLAKRLAETPNTIHLTGEEMREVWTDLSWSEEERQENQLRIARLALTLSFQGFDVVVTTMKPKKATRKEIRRITGCRFIEIKGKTWRNPSRKPFGEAHG